MENAIENTLRAAGVSYRKTKRAERIPGFGQAPDFCIPDEIHPIVVIEAKITSDDGTARDKVARIKVLASQRDEHAASGRPAYEVVACIDGRGFRQRREDMRQMLKCLGGKVFTAATRPAPDSYPDPGIHKSCASTRLIYSLIYCFFWKMILLFRPKYFKVHSGIITKENENISSNLKSFFGLRAWKRFSIFVV